MLSDKAKKTSKDTKNFYIICIIVTLAVLLAIFAVFMHQRTQVAPVYVLTVEGLKAGNPAEAQALCRTDSNDYEKLMEGTEECSWVWGGENTLYLVHTKALRIDVNAGYPGFTAVTFKDEHGKTLSGYIIDPTGHPNEMGRIVVDESEEYTYDSVSMSVRVALREGKISYDDAVYLWEEGSNEVFAVYADSYTVIKDKLVSFVDDGGQTRVCYILDTTLD